MCYLYFKHDSPSAPPPGGFCNSSLFPITSVNNLNSGYHMLAHPAFATPVSYLTIQLASAKMCDVKGKIVEHNANTQGDYVFSSKAPRCEPLSSMVQHA